MRERRTILVTGASAGLGLALARRLCATDDNLVLTARQASLARFAVEEIYESERVMITALDVTRADERRRVAALAAARFGDIDVLINNAGVAYRSVTEHVTEADMLAQMDVNFRSPMELARLVLPAMRARRRGHIINVSSVSGMMAMPTMAVYSASKFALEGATEALYYEVRPWNVHVSLVQPGFIHSTSFQKVRFTRLSGWSADHDEDDYHAHYEHMSPFIARMMERSRSTPDAVAKKILKLMNRRRPPLRVAGTFDASVFSLVRRLLPRAVYHWLLYRSLPRVSRWGVPAASRAQLVGDRALPLPPPPEDSAAPISAIEQPIARPRAPRGTGGDESLRAMPSEYAAVESSDAVFDSVGFSIASRSEHYRGAAEGDSLREPSKAPPGVDS